MKLVYRISKIQRSAVAPLVAPLVAGAVVLLTLGAGCQPEGAASAEGMGWESWLQQAYLGAPNRCAEDDDCASGVCRFDACVGALATDQRWLQAEVANNMAERLAEHPDRQADAVTTLRAVTAAEARGRERVEARAAFVASHLPGEVAADYLRELVRSDGGAAGREAALGLARRGDDSGLLLVLGELQAAAAPRRAEAARALGGLKGERVLDALTGALDDDMRQVRRNAMASLGRLGDRRGALPLLARLEDGPTWERVAALRALRAITGERLGLDSEAWRKSLAGR